MIQRILSCLFIMVVIACKDDESPMGIHTFNALADITNAQPLIDGKEKYNMIVMYSTDGGQTYTDWPALKKGDQYMAKVVVRDDGDAELTSVMCYALDWSTSNPAPDNVSGNVAMFTMQKDNALIAKVNYTNYTPFNYSSWLGKFIGDESGDGNSSDKLTLAADPSNSNGVILRNFFGDGGDVTIKMVFTPSTNAGTQIVTIPAQQTSEGGSLEATTGTYDQCTLTLTVESFIYTVGGDTYDFGYSIHL